MDPTQAAPTASSLMEQVQMLPVYLPDVKAVGLAFAGLTAVCLVAAANRLGAQQDRPLMPNYANYPNYYPDYLRPNPIARRVGAAARTVGKWVLGGATVAGAYLFGRHLPAGAEVATGFAVIGAGLMYFLHAQHRVRNSLVRARTALPRQP